jgi:hypothetical protein
MLVGVDNDFAPAPRTTVANHRWEAVLKDGRLKMAGRDFG